MANNKAAPGPAPEPKQTDKAPEFFDWAVFAGVCAAKEWKPGKAVTEEEFLAAVREFNAAPMTGARKESEAKK